MKLFSFLPPAYVVRREGNSFTLFVSPHLGGGGSAGGGVSRGGQVPGGSAGGSGPAGGGQVLGGSGPGGGQVPGGVSWGGLRGGQPGGGQRAVCLLRSRRRSFLFRKGDQYIFKNTVEIT